MSKKGVDESELLKNYLDKMGIKINSVQAEQFVLYRERLIEKSKVMNLTSITEPVEVEIKHFIDSVSIIPFLQSALSQPAESFDNCKIIDVGTGAGFPGIPLKILFPEIELTLMDSLQKRVGFLQEVCNELNLKNVNCVHGRAEDMAHDIQYREAYDIAIARAVAPLPVLSEYCLPFVKKNKIFVSMKAKLSEELIQSKNAISILGGEIESLHEFNLYEGDIFRSVLIIRKNHKTSDTYPRKAGTPAKNPL